MINREDLKSVLKQLKFNLVEGTDNTYQKTYEDNTDNAFSLSATFEDNKVLFHYPDDIKMDRSTTVDDHQKESYVVFDCVARLFDVGYRPENITLEGLNHEGHDQGWIDILVKDNEGTEYLIIECKTSAEKDKKDDEFEKHWKRTLNDGDQLFRYFNTYSKAQFLCLYTADFVDEKLSCTYHVITLKDNEEYLKSNKKLKSYKTLRENQGSKEEFFEVWKNTYLQDYSTNGIFESDCKPFDIGQKKISIEDLKEIDSTSMQKKYNEFATILRKYNVSSKENAFDKLINLFLAKIVDETNNQSELKCLWKGAAYDNYFDMQDRLLGLYKIGMEKFFKEDVAYVENDEIENAFKFLKNASEEDVAKKTILEYFRILKYFNNNPFAFLDVHNENLFYQNAVILKEIVNMVQDIRIKTEEQNQFLGDLFEGFLDQGIKQSEGQFFTPLPIVKFLISSLPLDNLIKESKDLPKVIDYACGAGHFLTEYANQIKPIVKKHNKAKIENYYANIFGIEKEYRLSKVSQVSAFMYGQNEIKILYRDALAHTPEVQEGIYSVLIANPPYSVKGFLETLSDEDRESYELYNSDLNIDTNNSIETFFVERAKQLLKKDGIAAIVLPSSVLSNGNIYIKCREIILKYFDLVAIFESGSGTFGKTGTNTATLFMRRREDTPSLAEQYQNRVDSWFSGNFDYDKVYEDFDKVEKYCLMQNYQLEDYKKFLAGELTENLLENEIFAGYKKLLDIYSIEGRQDTKKLNNKAKNIRTNARIKAKTKSFKSLNEEERKDYENKILFSFCTEIEKDKLYYFMLSISNDDVLVIKSPDNTTNIKKFLGYEWSDSKGNEGIKYLNVKVDKAEDGEETDDTMEQIKGIEGIQTPLFNPKDFDDKTKLNYYVRQKFMKSDSAVFESVETAIPQDLQSYANYVPLCEMIDFSRTGFDKAIKTQLKNEKGEMKIESKYPLVKLGEVCEVKIGGTPDRKNSAYFEGNNLWVSISEMNGQIITDTKEKITDDAVNNSNVKLIPKGTTLFSFKLSIGKTAIAGKNLYTNEAIAGLIPIDKNKITDNFLFQYFNSSNFDVNCVGNKAFGKSLNSTYLREELKIPLPPKDIQESIVSECEQIDKEYSDAQKKIEECKNEISVIMENVKGEEKKISEVCKYNSYSINPSSTPKKEFIYVDIESVKNGTGEIVFEKKILGNNAPSRARRLAKSKSTLVSTVRPNLKGFAYLENEMENAVYSTGFAIFETVDENKLLSKMIYYFFMYSELLMKQMLEAMPKGQYPSINNDNIDNFKIPVPSLADQKKIVEQITALEEQIADAKKVMADCPQKKTEVLKKWL